MDKGLECRLQEFLQNHPEIKEKSGKFRIKNSSFWVKLPKNFSESLCRLLGMIHGDGNMSFGRILITDKSKDYHLVIKDLFEEVFGVTPNLFHDKNRNTYYSHLKRKVLYLFLVEVLEVPRGSVRKNLSPGSYVNSWDTKLKGSYLGGLLDSEGHVSKLQAKINFATTSEPIFDFVVAFLSEHKIKFGIYKRNRRSKNELEINIYGKQNISNLLNYTSFFNTEKNVRLEKFLPLH